MKSQARASRSMISHASEPGGPTAVAQRKRDAAPTPTVVAKSNPGNGRMRAAAVVETEKGVAGATTLEKPKNGKFPPVTGSPGKTFARFGAAEWDERRTAFRDPLKAAAE